MTVRKNTRLSTVLSVLGEPGDEAKVDIAASASGPFIPRSSFLAFPV
jgi:hypothetical protein